MPKLLIMWRKAALGENYVELTERIFHAIFQIIDLRVENVQEILRLLNLHNANAFEKEKREIIEFKRQINVKNSPIVTLWTNKSISLMWLTINFMISVALSEWRKIIVTIISPLIDLIE